VKLLFWTEILSQNIAFRENPVRVTDPTFLIYNLRFWLGYGKVVYSKHVCGFQFWGMCVCCFVLLNPILGNCHGYCHCVAVWFCYWTQVTKYSFQLIANIMSFNEHFESNNLSLESTTGMFLTPNCARKQKLTVKTLMIFARCPIIVFKLLPRTVISAESLAPSQL